MKTPTPVLFHSSQFPAAVKNQMLQSLRDKQLRPKFHYVSYRQSQRWLALHQAYSPSRTDQDCQEIYARIFDAAADELRGKPVQLIGLGCGGGQKDRLLASKLKSSVSSLRYVPCDVSHALALIAAEAVSSEVPPASMRPLVADLLEAEDLESFWQEGGGSDEIRLFSFLGMIPNLEPSAIFPILRSWLRPQDRLIISANLLPGLDDEAGFTTVIPQYDNLLTRRWLTAALDDLDIPQDSYLLEFSVELSQKNPALKKVTANAIFTRAVNVEFEGQTFPFDPEDSFEILFSNRYRPQVFIKDAADYGLKVYRQEITASKEEGVWLAQSLA